MPKFVIELDTVEYDILRDYFLHSGIADDSTIEGSIIHGIISQLVVSYEDEPELYHDTTHINRTEEV